MFRTIFVGLIAALIYPTVAHTQRRHPSRRRMDPQAQERLRAWDRQEAALATAAATAQPLREAESRQRGCPPGMLYVPGGQLNVIQEELDWSGRELEASEMRQNLTAYCIDATEVTVAAYRGCTNCSSPGIERDCNWNRRDREQHPVNCVNWSQAVAYCSSVGARLPTEWEWQFAGRGSDGRSLPWGNFFVRDLACWSGGRGERSSTCPVRSFVGGNSPFGVFDLAGNVAEWATMSPRYGGVASGGGAWNCGLVAGESSDDCLHLGTMGTATPSQSGPWLGFRCAWSNFAAPVAREPVTSVEQPAPSTGVPTQWSLPAPAPTRAVNPCEASTNCADCAGRSNCVWCGASRQCMYVPSGRCDAPERGSCGGSWTCYRNDCSAGR